MNDQLTRRLVLRTVREFCDDGRSFSAWDITRAARELGGRGVHHSSKQLVHDYFARGNMGALARIRIWRLWI